MTTYQHGMSKDPDPGRDSLSPIVPPAAGRRRKFVPIEGSPRLKPGHLAYAVLGDQPDVRELTFIRIHTDNFSFH
jgi:hypothetical protein